MSLAAGTRGPLRDPRQDHLVFIFNFTEHLAALTLPKK
jgi:hypothetical protein